MVIIAGAGIGGLTLALCLHQRGIACQIFEASARIEPLGVGINVLPHAMRELTALGLQARLLHAGVATREVNFYNRFGQFIHSDSRGRYAGYPWPQVSIHRGQLQQILHQAVLERLGPEAVQTGKCLLGAQQETGSVAARFSVGEGEIQTVTGDVLIGCDGIRSALRRQLYPQPGADPLIYSGITMWRGVTRQKPFLSGATMAYAGWLSTGKVIAYPITPPDPHDGTQLINWLCEFYVPPRDASGDWSRAGRPEDFLWACKEMTFDWLDIPGLVQAADYIYEYPMVDRNPLPRWSHGRLTLLGDAAHPMYPRGSNGAGQAIVDARALADALAASQDGPQALQHYDEVRRPATGKVVIANRTIPPDAILRAVYERTGDQPFEHIEDVISSAELTQLSQAYKEVAGFDKESLTAADPQ